ncbi:MAG: hypothetical protein NC078_12620 [Ruminococcus sp.]|nr:hypothetical protein [Ruminococcus sp.]
MADKYKKVDFPISQPIKGLALIEVGEADFFLMKPDKIEREPNRVRAYYGNYLQTITADGEGNERHNFKQEITKIN